MSAALGTSVAVPPELLAELLGCTGDEARLAWIEDLEERDDLARLEFDADWTELHRALGDGGSHLAEDGPPLAQAVLGAEPVFDDDRDAFAGLLRPEDVPDVARAVSDVDAEWLDRRLAETTPDQDVRAAVRATFGELREFLTSAAASGAAVVFSVL